MTIQEEDRPSSADPQFIEINVSATHNGGALGSLLHEATSSLRERTALAVKAAEPPSKASLQKDAVDSMAKWAISAFALLVGLLGFFGIKDGALDLMVRTFPHETETIFVLLGSAVLAALFTPVIDWRAMSMGWLPLYVAMLTLAIGIWAASVLDQNIAIYIGGVAVLAAVSAVLLLRVPPFVKDGKQRLAWHGNVKLLVVSIALANVGAGSLMTADLSVASKARDQAVQVDPSISGTGSSTAAKISVSGGHLEGKKVFVQLYSTPSTPVASSAAATDAAEAKAVSSPAKLAEFTWYSIFPDANGQVSSAIDVPIGALVPGQLVIAAKICNAGQAITECKISGLTDARAVVNLLR